MNDTNVSYWKKCSTCKKEIGFSKKYYLCSVGTCKHKRKGFRFCSVNCWDAHIGILNHKSAWAEDMTSPSEAEYKESLKKEARKQPKRTIVGSSSNGVVTSGAVGVDISHIETKNLVIPLRIEKLLDEHAGMKTSKCCIEALTKKVLRDCMEAAEKARAANRKTVMGKDVG